MQVNRALKTQFSNVGGINMFPVKEPRDHTLKAVMVLYWNKHMNMTNNKTNSYWDVCDSIT